MRLEAEQLATAQLGLAGQFISGARHLADPRVPGWLASTCLLLGQAAELLAKHHLLRLGHDPLSLRGPTYRHDRRSLWVEHTDLYLTASHHYRRLKSAGDISTGFFFPAHFQRLCWLHGKDSEFASRYGNGNRLYPSPEETARVLSEVHRAERMAR